MKPRALAVPQSRLGESPLWDAAAGAVYWIDVWGRALHRFSLADELGAQWDLGAEPGCVLRGAGGRLVIALPDGMVEFDPDRGASRALAHPEVNRPGGRYNDGAIDAAGRLWIGSVGVEGSPTGSLYRLDRAEHAAVIAEGLLTPNGIAFSPDGTIMYFTVTERREILSFDLDPRTGEVAARGQLVIDTDCFPDGLTVAADGTLWSAKWEGWRVSRYGPDGTLLAEIEFPVPNVTSLAFGGPQLDRLFVTTAADDTVATRPGHETDAGRLFVVDGLGVRGLAEPALAFGPPG